MDPRQDFDSEHDPDFRPRNQSPRLDGASRPDEPEPYHEPPPFDVDQLHDGPALHDGAPPFDVATPRDRQPLIILTVLLITAIGATGYWLFRTRSTQPAPAATTAATEPAPDAAAPPPTTALGGEPQVVDLPPIDQSDAVVRSLVRELTANPTVASWLATDNLIRTFTAVTANIASGQPASGQVRALRPATGFQVQERGEELVIDPRSYARYLPLATAVSSADPQDVARLYATLKPRIQEAYADLGFPDRSFDDALERAIVTLLRTPIPSGSIAVVPNGAALAYRFDDPALEQLTPEQKLLIRFGPDNARTVLRALRNIALALGIPPDRLPQPA